jgi:hypothetical protein
MEAQQLKQAVGVIAIALTFIGYIPYYRDIVRKRTHPHLYSWALWGLLTILIVALQLTGGAGISALVTASAGFLCFGVIVLGLKHGKRDITTSDKVVAIMSLIAMAFWLIAKQPITSIFLAVIADLLAFGPTIRKSWNKPQTETLSLYTTNTLRFGLAVIAVKNYTILSTLWPASWVFANGAFAVMLITRRRQLRRRR